MDAEGEYVDPESLTTHAAHFCDDLIGRVEFNSFDSRLASYVSHVPLPRSYVSTVSRCPVPCALLGAHLETVTVSEENQKDVFVAFYSHSRNVSSYDSDMDIVSHVIPKSRKSVLMHELQELNSSSVFHTNVKHGEHLLDDQCNVPGPVNVAELYSPPRVR